MTSSGLLLKTVSNGIYFNAECDALWLRRDTGLEHVNFGSTATWSALVENSGAWRDLPTAIEQLMEMGLAAPVEGDMCFEYRGLGYIQELGFEFPRLLAEPAPFLLSIESRGALGRPEFRYICRFFYGTHEISPKLWGCFARYGDLTYRLDPQMYALVDEIKKFNNLPPAEKEKRNALIAFSRIKELSKATAADLDEFLGSNEVIVPSETHVDLLTRQDDVTMVPRFDGVPQDDLIRKFLRMGEVQDIYDLEGPDRRRVRVVLDDEQREALRRMQRVRHVRGNHKKKILANPVAVFEGLNQDRIDLKSYGDRVKGIGDFVFVAIPYASYTRSGLFDDISEHARGPRKFNAGIEVKVPGSNETVKIPFENVREVSNAARIIRDALTQGEFDAEIKGKRVIVTNELLKGLENLENKLQGAGNRADRDPVSPRLEGKYLLIYTNYDSLEFTESLDFDDKLQPAEIPESMTQSSKLLPHQLDGISWLQRKFRSQVGQGGVLLADDMGLGKTLQLLVFLAWAIEGGHVKPEGGNLDIAPWNPILVIMPKILLENNTWINDAEAFFGENVSLFHPYLVLHGTSIKNLRKQSGGAEVELGVPLLDIEQFYKHRVVFTNYETVQNYQHSFALVDWSIVVTDEAQKYKTANSKTSHSLKALKTSFRVGLTGTPVENRLLDLWNIADFLQPGLLNSAKEFSTRFEKPLSDGNSGIIEELRRELKYGQPGAFLLRRDKQRHLKGLPEKNEVIIESVLSQEQWELHCEVIRKLQESSGQGKAFQCLHELSQLYQHPNLLDPKEGGFPSADEAFKRSPKLQSVARELENISQKKEKAIIFARYIKMQGILADTLGRYFGLKIDIINGDPTIMGSQSRNLRTSNLRADILKRFGEKDGFNILILSPSVAGIGLTITSANHVIHYGRWWNPAVEAQATDRVYRLGQEKPVFVYLPISRWSPGVRTFDEKLHDILEHKKWLAADFLQPMPEEGEIARELEDDILGASDKVQGTARSLGEMEIQRMTPREYEALLSAIFSKKGYLCTLTPLVGDGGADVVAVNDREVVLLQCKHMIRGSLEFPEALTELLNALELYRSKSGLIQRNWRMLVACSSEVSSTFRRHAKSSQCEVLDGRGCVAEAQALGITWRDVSVAETARVGTLREAIAKLSEIKGG